MTGFQLAWVLFALAHCGCSGALNGAAVERHPPPGPKAEPALSSGDPLAAAPAKSPPKPSASPERASSIARSWSFDEGPLGQLPPDFLSVVGQWQLSHDESGPSGSPILAQSASSAKAVFNLVLAKGTSYRDVDLSVRLRSVAGRIDQGGGLVWRARDAGNYYIARYNPLEDNLRLYTVVDGRRQMIESATVRIDHDAWHTLRITMRGDQTECFLDGTKHLDRQDGTFSDAGQIGLWTKADAQTHFDDLSVREAASSSERP